VEEIIQLPNSHRGNRERRFLITPEQYLAAEKSAHVSNLQLLGFYHSHPDHEASPSVFDKECAFPWFLYLILSVADGKAVDLNAWELTEDRTQFLELRLCAEQLEEHLA